eukprot:CAMPEP_0179171288 /NCGR_PEP_ID=MMETSP0796-20121207/84429_1 /TAXON_ID=73915 /ORGANISM="Pyrodinium bahamense, Strain pbaha01" /LENGTH=60 /DNA_ID=CAMNT_0020874347 /DNA_START=2 /DNA_END=180 /DNA_ORIENTATION=+
MTVACGVPDDTDAYDGDYGALGFSSRGWAVRHGRRKRLAALMWGKKAEGSSQEGKACRGR